MKKCPYCGKEILEAAKKCKHCGKWIELQSSEVENTEETNAEEADTETKQWPKYLIGIIIGIACTCLIGGGYFLFKPKPEPEPKQLYIRGYMQPTSDWSLFVGIAADEFEDCLAGGKCESADLQIVTYHPGSKPNSLTTILKSSQVEGFIYEMYPSTIYPNLVYFNVENYDYESLYGMIDIKNKEYKLFKGSVLGIVTYGRYKDCYLVLDEEQIHIHIYSQEPIWMDSNLIKTISAKKYLDNVYSYASSWHQSMMNQFLENNK